MTVGVCLDPTGWLRPLEATPLPASSLALLPLTGPVISRWVHLRVVWLAKGRPQSWLLLASRGVGLATTKPGP